MSIYPYIEVDLQLPQAFTKSIKSSNSPMFLCAFYAYLFFLPLPLGSNRAIAWHAGQLFIFGLFLIYFVIHSDYIISVIKKQLIPVLILLSVAVWLLFQLIPLPLVILELISPGMEKIYTGTNISFASISLDSQATIDALLKLCSYICVFILGLSLIKTSKRLIAGLLFFVVTGCFNGFYGAFEILSGQDYSFFLNMENSHRANGTFVYHNHFANFLLLCLAAGLGYFIATLSSSNDDTTYSILDNFLNTLIAQKTAVRLGLTIMVIALVMSHSRMGNTAFFASLFIVSILYIVIGQKVPRSFKILVLSMLLIDTFIVSSWFGLEKVKDRLEATSLEAESRDEVVMDTISIIKDFPITGTGAGSFETVFASFQTNNVNSNYDHAHNDYLEFTLEYGLPATFLLGLFLIYVSFIALKTLRNSSNRQLAGVCAGALMAIIGMLIHMTVDFPLLPPANSSFFILLLAMACTAYNNTKNKIT